MENPLTKAYRYVMDSLPFFEDTQTGRIRRAFSNQSTGAGTETDVVESTTINTYRRFTRRYLEGVYANLWAAAKIVDLKPNDVFGPGIIWSEDDEQTKRMIEEFKRLKVWKKVHKAVIAARLFGTSVVIFAPKDGNFKTPLDPENVRPDEISHLLIADRYNLEELVLYSNPAHPMFGQAELYRWNFTQVQGQPTEGQERMDFSSIDIHASRCIRFDGVPPTTDDGWDSSGEERWGISVLQRAIDDIIEDAVASSSLIDILKRACVPVIKKHGWTEVLARGGQTYQGEVSPEQAVSDISRNVSNAKLMIIDGEDDVDNLEVETSGVKDIANLQTHRVAMIDGIPITRFTGESATGMSATGDGDARDWRITVQDYRRDSIEPQFETIMSIVAQNAGLPEVPDWEWGQLGEATLEEKATTTKTLGETAEKLVASGVIDEEEARALMNNSEIVDLDESDVPPVPVIPDATAKPTNVSQMK